MKGIFSVLFLTFLATCSVNAMKINMLEEVQSLLQNKAKLNDAFSTIDDFINTLMNTLDEEGDKAQKRNETEEKDCVESVAKFTNTLNAAKKVLSDAQAHQKFVEDEQHQTDLQITYIENRLKEIDETVEKDKESQCKSNFEFIMQLKEHSDAIVLIDQLIVDVKKYFADKKGGVSGSGGSSQSQHKQTLKKFALIDKLKTYEHLFNDEGKQILGQLSAPRTVNEMVGDTQRRDIGNDSVDNEQAKMELKQLKKNQKNMKWSAEIWRRTPLDYLNNLEHTLKILEKIWKKMKLKPVEILQTILPRWKKIKIIWGEN